MSDFPVHTIDSAPSGSRPLLEKLAAEVGFVPNLAASMAESPTTLEAFTTLRSIFRAGSLSAVEREAIALTVSFDNACTYCMAAHSTFARMAGAPDSSLHRLRAGELPDDPRLAALCAFTRRVLDRGGHVAREDLARFLDAGFTRDQVLEVLVGIGVTTLANHTHNIAASPIDSVFAPLSWTRPPGLERRGERGR